MHQLIVSWHPLIILEQLLSGIEVTSSEIFDWGISTQVECRNWSNSSREASFTISYLIKPRPVQLGSYLLSFSWSNSNSILLQLCLGYFCSIAGGPSCMKYVLSNNWKDSKKSFLKDWHIFCRFNVDSAVDQGLATSTPNCPPNHHQEPTVTVAGSFWKTPDWAYSRPIYISYWKKIGQRMIHPRIVHLAKSTDSSWIWY